MLRAGFAMLCLSLSACTISAGNSCLVGASFTCACTDGRSGAQVCEKGGTLGPCVCTGATGGGGISGGGGNGGSSGGGGNGGVSGGGGNGGSSGSLCNTSAAPATCSTAISDSTQPSDQATLVSLITGRWLICSCPWMSLGRPGTVGMEFTADLHFYFLYADANGNIVRGGDFDDQGTYNLSTSGDFHQFNLLFADGGFNGGQIVFSTSPRKMQLSLSTAEVVFATGD